MVGGRLASPSRQRRLNSVVADATRRFSHRYPALKRRAKFSRRPAAKSSCVVTLQFRPDFKCLSGKFNHRDHGAYAEKPSHFPKFFPLLPVVESLPSTENQPRTVDAFRDERREFPDTHWQIRS